MVRNILARLYRRCYQMLWRSSLPESSSELQPDEPICRYLLSSSHYATSKGRVKSRAFHPAPADHKTSVFRISDLTDRDIWKIGDREVVAKRQGKTLHARADLTVRKVREVRLSVDASEPPPRHANITSWPQEKSAYMSRAQELAVHARLQLRD